MHIDELFWKASVEELKKGYAYDDRENVFICLICGNKYEKGVIYQADGQFYEASKAVEAHIRGEHGSMFEYMMDMGKKYTGLTDRQKELMELFYQGCSHREIAERLNGISTSTVRNHLFNFREKYKQAKIVVVMTELLEENKNSVHSMKKGEELIDIPKKASSVDDRFAITQEERDKLLAKYFDRDNNSIKRELPAKEKRKIIILQHLLSQFEMNRKYSEKEVNGVIKKFFDDVPMVRRSFIEYGFLDRTDDGKTYWVKI